MDKKTKAWVALMNVGARFGCHQRADRSFFYKGYQFPICARCTGVFIGEVLAVVALLCGVPLWWPYGLALVVPLAVDGCLQYVHVWRSNNLRRVITGVLAGFGLTYAEWQLLVFLWGLVTKA